MKNTSQAPSEPVLEDDDSPKPPVHITPGIQVPAPQHQADVLGIISIVMAFLPVAFSQIVGFILGIIGVKKAKREGRSATVSRVGWILNLIFGAIGIIALLVFVVFIAIGARDADLSARDQERKGEIQILHSRLEDFYNNNGYYPGELNVDSLPSINSGYLTGPDGVAYTYAPSPQGCSKCASYQLSTFLERESDGERGFYYLNSLNSSVDSTVTPTFPTSSL